MTPTEVITAARQSSNSETTAFFTDAELITYLNFGLNEVLIEGQVLETSSTSATTPTTTTAGTETYTLDSDVLEIKRVEVDGEKLHPVSFGELDKLNSTLQQEDVAGTPRYYAVWGNKLYFAPIPDTSSLVITLYYTHQHTVLTTASTAFDATLPAMYQSYLIDYVVYRMYLKDQDERAATHLQLWQRHLTVMRQQAHGRKRRDRFNVVQSEDNSITTILGIN